LKSIGKAGRHSRIWTCDPWHPMTTKMWRLSIWIYWEKRCFIALIQFQKSWFLSK